MAAKKRRSPKRRRRQALPESSAFVRKTHTAVRSHLSGSTDLQTFVASAGELTLAQRKRIVEQALILIDDNYAHLPLKRAMHAVDPVQRLKLLLHRLDRTKSSEMPKEWHFHREMINIFTSVRDLHTNYILPSPFNRFAAFLPFEIEEYFDNGERHYLASNFVSGFNHATFGPGVEVTHWSGVPIDLAVAVIADRHAGSNEAARHARGVAALTIRSLTTSLPPDERWVVVGYRTDAGEDLELRVDWLVNRPLPDSGSVNAGRATEAAASLGLDLETDSIRLVKRTLYAPKVVAAEARRGRKKKLSTRMAAAGQSVTSAMPSVFSARNVPTASGTFGHIRIRTFNVNDPDGFVSEFVRLASLLPQNGLIIDVRGNGGGHIHASERLLQTLTPRFIQPERTQFINTPLNLRICRRHRRNPVGIDLGPWVESLAESVETGAVYSRGFPITPVESANRIGQRYHGPVVLITDARCYSATDIFAAGFQDHGIGPTLGTDDRTGAGGANVWEHQLLRRLLELPDPPDSRTPYERLPRGANLRVSVRRTLREGSHAGTPLEDLGVAPDHRHLITRNDLLNGNPDLLDRAGELLAAQPVRVLKAQTALQPDDSLQITAETEGFRRLDVFLDDRPQRSLNVSDGQNDITLPAPAGRASRLELQGYRSGELVAALKMTI